MSVADSSWADARLPSSSKSVTIPSSFDFVDNERVPCDVVQDVYLFDPNDNQNLEPVVCASKRSVERSLQAAAVCHARGELASLPVESRASLLEQIANELEGQIDAIAYADARTTGVVIGLTRKFAGMVPMIFRGAAAEIRGGVLTENLSGPGGSTVEVRRIPWGPAAVIAPWNAPAAIASHKVASALAAGAPVILKPSEWAPHAARFLAEAIARAGLPTGAFQLVHGDGSVGAALVADPRVKAVSFTGGLKGGLAIARAAAETLKPVQLELGGNNPMVVLEGADLDAAAAGIVTGLTTLNGQWCRALGRLIVHESVAAALLEKALGLLEKVRVGSSLALTSEMGPLIHRPHYWAVRGAVERLVERGGRAHVVTHLPGPTGNFLAPTLVTGASSEDAVDEIFGPVATVHSFRHVDEARALVAASPFGLAGYVFGPDDANTWAFARNMPVGSVKINAVTLFALHPRAPRPAWGFSGYGDEGTLATLQFFTGHRVIGAASRG